MKVRLILIIFVFSFNSVLAYAAIDPSNMVSSFHRALQEGDRELVKKLLDPEVVIFEEGIADMSFSEYELYHLPSDIKFAKNNNA